MSRSTQCIAREVGVSHWTVHRTLREQLLYQYHIQQVQMLTDRDYQPRIHFCEWLIAHQQNADFLSNILVTDEAYFTRSGIQNLHKSHVWADETDSQM